MMSATMKLLPHVVPTSWNLHAMRTAFNEARYKKRLCWQYLPCGTTFLHLRRNIQTHWLRDNPYLRY